MNRWTRDQLLHHGLDQADLASLDQHDRPHGVIVEGAYSIQWLQAGLDLFHEKWPWSALLKKFPLTIQAHVDVYDLPADFVMDFQNGLRIDSITPDLAVRGRASKVGLSTILDAEVTLAPGTTLTQWPSYYTLHGINPSPTGVTGFASRLQLWPVPDRAYGGTLYYYSLPNVLLDGATVPTFPSDYVLVEFIRIRGLEWGRQLEVGTHLKFVDTVIGQLQKSGLGVEAGLNHLELDRTVFKRVTWQNQAGWLGSTTVPPS